MAAPSTTAPTGGTAELEHELLDSPGPTGLPPHAEEGVLQSRCDLLHFTRHYNVNSTIVFLVEGCWCATC